MSPLLQIDVAGRPPKHRTDPVNPIVGYLGSSNLTFSGLSSQGELNVDVLDHDATLKLARWFDERWNDRWCVDISDELAQIIEDTRSAWRKMLHCRRRPGCFWRHCSTASCWIT